MSLNFTNESRSYDFTRRAIRFWGYERASEISFFVTEEALQKLMSDAGDESAYLKAFDAYRERIRKAAAAVYRRGPRGSYEITARDL
jgi:hypothetical protein